MATRTILQIGNPLLKAVNKHVTHFDEQLSSLVTDLTETMRTKELVGIAAPQIGENYQVFLTEPRETKYRVKNQSDILRVYVNPELVTLSYEQVEIYEGCGSVDSIDLFGPVMRPREITITAQNEVGMHFRLTCNGILARIIQHELDHLKGITFTEKVHDVSRMLSFEQYQQYKNNNLSLHNNSTITKLEYVPIEIK